VLLLPGSEAPVGPAPNVPGLLLPLKRLKVASRS
jgi:hypothetical protein